MISHLLVEPLQSIVSVAFFNGSVKSANVLSAWWQPLLNQSEQEVQYYNALQLSGCDSLMCLRGLPIEELETLNQAVENASYPGPGNGYGVYNFGPVVDGRFLVELPGIACKYLIR